MEKENGNGRNKKYPVSQDSLCSSSEIEYLPYTLLVSPPPPLHASTDLNISHCPLSYYPYSNLNRKSVLFIPLSLPISSPTHTSCTATGPSPLLNPISLILPSSASPACKCLVYASTTLLLLLHPQKEATIAAWTAKWTTYNTMAPPTISSSALHHHSPPPLSSTPQQHRLPRQQQPLAA